jgi:SSS family solute:Na+ symporter
MGRIAIGEIDLAIIMIYISGLVFLGLIVSRRAVTVNSYFLAGHGARWPIIGLTILAMTVSPTALIGITGSAYAHGISVFNYEWVGSLLMALFAIAFFPAIAASRLVTIPEFLEARYDRRIRVWIVSMGLLLGPLFDAAGLYSGAVLLCQFVPHLSLQAAVIVLAVLAGACAVTGGLKAVIYTQSAQALTVMLTALIVASITFGHVGGLFKMLQSADTSKVSLILPASSPTMPWTGLLLGAPILGLFASCTNQAIVQRMLAARTMRDAQLGAIFGGFLKLLILFLIVLPGIAAIQIFPGLGRGDEAYPAMISALLPHGLLGLSLAAFAGALLTQLSASYLTTGTLFAMNVVHLIRPSTGEQSLVAWGRLGTAGSILLSIIWAPQIKHFGSIWQYLQTIFSYTAPPVVALFVFGFFWCGATARGAWAALVFGNGSALLLFAAHLLGYLDIHFLHAAAILMVASTTALIVGSKTRGPKTAPEVAIANSLQNRQGNGWFIWQRPDMEVRLGAAGLLLCATAMVWWLR